MAKSIGVIATPPGATIREQLNERGMSQKEFAARMALSEKHVSKLINGEVHLMPEMAVRLETVLGVPAQFWNNLEAIYREKLIRAEAERSLAADAELAKRFPYGRMAEYGWVPAAKDPNEKALNLRRFFEVVDLSLLESERITRIACYRLLLTEKTDLALMAWAQQAKLLAREIQAAPIDIKALTDALPALREMSRLEPAVFGPLIKERLARCGIVLIVLQQPSKASRRFASFLDGKKIVVAVAAGNEDTDLFWSSLFHELGHIALGHVERGSSTSEADERAADQWSQNALVAGDELEVFLQAGDYTEQSVLRFAEKLGIAPGIVVGRMQQEGVIRRNALNELKEKVFIAG